MSLLTKTPEEFMSNLPDLYLDIALGNVILCDTDDFMAEHLRSLRALFRCKGTRRERYSEDLIWRWGQPALDWTLEWEEAL